MAAGAGAIVAMIAVNHAAKVAHVVDVFRLGDATAPARARTLASLHIRAGAEVAELAQHGVLVHDARADTWYLSEAGYVTHRTRRAVQEFRTTKRVLVVLAIVLVVVAVALLVVYRRAQ